MWPSKEFFLAKRKEAKRARHAKYNDTEYNLEPNVKGSPGGLRDIQTILWVARRQFGSLSITALDLVQQGFLVDSELRHAGQPARSSCGRCATPCTCWPGAPKTACCSTHQRKIAALLGFEDGEGKLAVERFMQKYYRVVMGVCRTVRADQLQHFEDVLLRRGRARRPAQPLNSRFQVRDGYIEVTSARAYSSARPFAILEVFVLMAQHPEIKGVPEPTPFACCATRRHLIDDDFRQRHPQYQPVHRAVQVPPQGIHRNLRRMNRYGILGRYLPEFGHDRRADAARPVPHLSRWTRTRST